MIYPIVVRQLRKEDEQENERKSEIMLFNIENKDMESRESLVSPSVPEMVSEVVPSRPLPPTIPMFVSERVPSPFHSVPLTAYEILSPSLSHYPASPKSLRWPLIFASCHFECP